MNCFYNKQSLFPSLLSVTSNGTTAHTSSTLRSAAPLPSNQDLNEHQAIGDMVGSLKRDQAMEEHEAIGGMVDTLKRKSAKELEDKLEPQVDQ